MPEDEGILLTSGPYKGQRAYKRRDGSLGIGKEDPLPEDELVAKGISRGERAGGGFGKDEIGQAVAKKQKENEQDLVRSTLMSLMGGGAAQGASNLLGPSSKLVMSGAKALGSRLLGTGVGAATSGGIAALQGRSDVEPLMESGIDQLTDMGMNKVLGGLRFAASPVKNTKSAVTSLVGRLGKLSDTEIGQTDSLERMFNQFQLPWNAAMMTKGAPTAVLGENAKTAYKNLITRNQSGAVDQALGSEAHWISSRKSNAATTKEVQNEIIARKQGLKAREGALHDRFDQLANARVETHLVPQPPVMVASTVQPGVMVPIPQDPIEVTTRGAIKLDKTSPFVTEMSNELNNLKQTGSLNPATEFAISNLEGLIGGINNAPLVDGHRLMDYAATKKIRDSIAYLKREFPSVDTRKRQMVGTANKLLSSLSEDTHNTISTWNPNERLAHAEAVAATKSNAREFNPKITRRLTAGQDVGESVGGADLDVNQEQVVMNALKSATGVETLLRAWGPQNKEKLSSMFVKIGFDKAHDPKTGLFDGNKLAQYFEDPKNVSVLESSGIVTPDQRRTIKDFTRYMQRAAKSVESKDDQGFDWKHSRMFQGGLSFMMGAGAGMAGSGSMPLAALTGGALGVTIPVGIHFLENVLLDPSGGALIKKLIYSGPKQQETAKRQIFDLLLKTGTKFGIRYQNQDGTVQEEELGNQ
jgi:hypothetical protein